MYESVHDLSTLPFFFLEDTDKLGEHGDRSLSATGRKKNRTSRTSSVVHENLIYWEPFKKQNQRQMRLNETTLISFTIVCITFLLNESFKTDFGVQRLMTSVVNLTSLH